MMKKILIAIIICILAVGLLIIVPYLNRAYEEDNGEATKIPVITYHRLCADDKYELIKQQTTLFVKEGEFDKQMNYLHENGYRTISTDEFYQWWAGEISLPKKSVLISFDDGNYSVIKYALPILKKYNQKATIFAMGVSTPDVTNRNKHDSDSYYCIGKDVIAEVQEEYPNLEFQSHTWALHNRVKGEKPVNSFTVKQLEEDATLQYNTFGYTALAYPWGTTSDNMIEALKNEGHTNIAFTYGENEYATREDDQFYVNRIKINGPGNLKDFKKWFK